MTDQQGYSQLSSSSSHEEGSSHHIWIEKMIRTSLERNTRPRGRYRLRHRSGKDVDDPKLRDTGGWPLSKQMWFLGKCVAEAMPSRR